MDLRWSGERVRPKNLLIQKYYILAAQTSAKRSRKRIKWRRKKKSDKKFGKEVRNSLPLQRKTELKEVMPRWRNR